MKNNIKIFFSLALIFSFAIFVSVAHASMPGWLGINPDGGITAVGTFNSGSDLDATIDPNVAGSGTRLIWYPKKSAFRAGTIFGFPGTQWDDVNIGDYSFAFGYNTQASGNASTAFGNATRALGDSSTAFGNSTTANNTYSTAFGQATFATGLTSTAFGSRSNASGDYATAFGQLSNATGGNSTAFGNRTNATAPYATAFGYGTTASGEHSTAFGLSTTSGGYASTAFGHLMTVTGNRSVGIGLDTTPRTVSASSVFSVMGGNVGVGTVAPSTTVDIFKTTSGAIKIVDGTQGTGKVLTSDANGVGTWQTPTGGGGNAWNLVGNAGTTAGTNFIGTTDSQDFVTKTNNTEKMRVLSSGNVGIGTNAPEFKLSVDNDGGIMAKGTFGQGATLTTTGAGVRMFWYPKKAAFRAGGGGFWKSME